MIQAYATKLTHQFDWLVIDRLLFYSSDLGRSPPRPATGLQFETIFLRFNDCFTIVSLGPLCLRDILSVIANSKVVGSLTPANLLP